MARDQIYLAPRSHVQPFQFDAQVAQVFDDMIRRSIPGYGVLLELIELAALRYAQDNTHVYDLGCSLGAVSAVVGRALAGRALSLHAVDQSADMVQRCRQLLGEQVPGHPIDVQQGDVCSLQLKPASLVVLNFTLQFVPQPERLSVLRNVRQALVPGGVLILSEKLGLEPQQRAILEPLHDAFRRRNGYTQLEISQKRNALEHVLVCDTEATHQARLLEAGFGAAVCWFRAANFCSWLVPV